jgi:hypothetical protein
MKLETMSRTTKEGKRGRPAPGRKHDPAHEAIIKRHTFGRTEKILRRNRKTWTRLGNKRRRQDDKATIVEGDVK